MAVDESPTQRILEILREVSQNAVLKVRSKYLQHHFSILTESYVKTLA